jgi:hypothetical protein
MNYIKIPMYVKYSIVFVFLLTVLPQCKKESVNNPAYAIGTINSYQYQVILEKRSRINYSFTVNGTTYTNSYKDKEWGREFKVPAAAVYSQGQQFMVQYDQTNPGTSAHHDRQNRMLFKYAVNDSSDYRNYVNQFATKPPR